MKLWESGSFDVHKNTIAPIIMMLGCSELDTEILDVGMETAESSNCRGMFRKNRDANGILATI